LLYAKAHFTYLFCVLILLFMTMQMDLTQRSRYIHWPAGFDPANADLYSHNELTINAPCDQVWQNIIDATKWPQWYPNSKDVRILSNGDTVQREGTVFRWTTFGLPLESTVHECVPDSRIGWFGCSPGSPPSFYHSWYLTPHGDGCDVVMDEVGKGPAAIRLRQTNEGLMHRGHNLWLVTLAWISENPSLV
jgi:uncharacterized protein YndB with AHSA1/START domain